MPDQPDFNANSAAFDGICGACGARHGTLSRRRFLCTGAAGAVAAPVIAASISSQAAAQPVAGTTPGRPILLKDGCVLTLDRALGDFEKADVLIEGTRISAVQPNISAPNAEVIDASRAIVMPGFVDTHRHMWQGIIRNTLADASLDDYRRDVLNTFGPAYRPEDVYAGNLVSALGAIDMGVTTVLDWSHIQNTPEHTDAAIKGLRESGLRALFAYGAPSNGIPRWWEDTRHKFPDDIKRLRTQYFASDDQLVTLFLASPSGPPDQILKAWAAAREVGARISIHVGVGEFGRVALLQRLNESKALKSDTTYIHCCTLNDTEWKLIADTGGTVSIAGYVEMLMGHGIPPVQRAIDNGIRPSLSVDVETSVPSDLFQQMRTVLSLQKNDVWARGLAGQRNLPPFLKAREVLEFATIEGARANGLDRRIGTLTPGKEADVILLRHDRLNVMPMNNAVGAVVSNMGPQNVDTVLIAGKVMKRNGQMIGVDYDRLGKLLSETRDRAFANAKFTLSRV